jgi:ABC-type multidrug transport system ATPase subunit
MSAVEVNAIAKNYNGEHALKNISFRVDKGTICGLIGADGAGKTTLLRIITTLVNADSGNASILGLNVTKDLIKIRSTIGYMPQRFSLYQDLTVKENLQFFADVYGVETKVQKLRMKKLLEFSRLDQFQKRRAANLSGGMKQKLALACALIHTPDLLILDEPTTGVDPVSRNEFWKILKDLKDEGITIVVSTPYMDEARLCDQLLIMHNGVLLKDGTPGGLLREYPYSIYKIENKTDTLNCSQEINTPDGVKLMYPSGGAIHVIIDKSVEDISKIFTDIKKVIPKAEQMVVSEPSIEDLFFLIISDKETTTLKGK